MQKIPKCEWAVIGGSSTFSLAFPEDLRSKETRVVEEGLIFETPFGQSPPFTLFELKGRKVITCRMHGWRKGVSRASASRQVFWVFRKAGVKRIVAEGGVGSISPKLKVRDLVIPDDYIDLSLRRDVSLSDDYLLIMREPLCPTLRALLVKAARQSGSSQVHNGGVYAVTDGRHFESRAEILMLSKLGADMVGQSLAPEVYLAREIGACYAGIYQVVNYAEGVKGEWDYEEFKDIFSSEAKRIGNIIVRTLSYLHSSLPPCSCQSLRKPTLLKEP
jgi:5'-methylthioadenosine phosphorylase